MPFYYLLAFSARAVPRDSDASAARTLRELIDEAAGPSGRFPRAVRCSIAPGSVMLAFSDDGTPERALTMVEGVQQRIAYRSRAGHRLPDIAAVLVSGPMSHVDVLGHSSNFEGLPAIAAVRILARLEPGTFAIERSLHSFESLRDRCGPEREIVGKHDQRFVVRDHLHIVLTGSRVPLPAPPVLTPAVPAPAAAARTVPVGGNLEQGPDAVAAAVPHELEPPPADFTGREHEIQDVLAAIGDQHRPILVHGMAGVGKSCLASAVAIRIADRFPDGQIVIDMRGADESPRNPVEAITRDRAAIP